MRKEFRPELGLPQDAALDVPKKSAASKTGSKRAAISGNAGRRLAIKAAGRATPAIFSLKRKLVCKRSGPGILKIHTIFEGLPACEITIHIAADVTCIVVAIFFVAVSACR